VTGTGRDDGQSQSEHEAVLALERLGLSNYEARVFTALQKLGDGTAREVHEVAGVPRSQVYGAADELEARGLLEIQQSTPKRYRPVSLDLARERLEESIEREKERAFDYLSTVRREQRGDESRDDVWTVRGNRPVSNRVGKLAATAEDHIMFGADSPEQAPEDVVDVLVERAEGGVDVVVVSATKAVRDRFDHESITTFVPPQDPTSGFDGRVLIVDDDTVLLSVLSESGTPAEETAIWSSETSMARVIARITENGIRALLRE
jgi:sugar-specific transcriptional regulator TrmB